MRRQLVVVFVAVTTMVALAFVVPLGLLVRSVARERALDDASRDTSALFPVLAVSDDPADVEIGVSRTPAGSAGRLAVYLPDGTVVGADLPASGEVADAIDETRAWTGDVTDGAEVVVPVVRADGSTAVVRVFVPDDELNEGVWAAWLALAGVGLALIAGSVVLADRLARSITSPVTELAEASHRLGDGDLAARVEPKGPPEIEAVGSAFNLLAARVDELLHAEREDVADLAHRLRTPLAALRLQLDQVDDDEVRSRLGRSADDLAAALDAVIEEARRRSRESFAVGADAVGVVLERARFWEALAEEQGRRAGTEVVPERMLVAVGEDELTAALDVVLENVFSHTADGVAYDVSVVREDDLVVIAVADEGGGLDHADAADRGVSGGGSTGLGLDIARRTAEHAGGTFDVIARVPRGTTAEFRLPIVG